MNCYTQLCWMEDGAIGPISSLLHLLPLLCGFLSVVYLAWKNAMRERKQNSRYTAKKLLNIIHAFRYSKNLSKAFVENAEFVLAFCGVLVVGLWTMITGHGDPG